jgi:hypothetical protein
MIIENANCYVQYFNILDLVQFYRCLEIKNAKMSYFSSTLKIMSYKRNYYCGQLVKY